jgi:hypothetical protein
MYQGFQGSWKFFLPFTSDPGEGAYLFLFYLSLGHIARIVNLPLLLVFHVFRLFGCLLLLIALWWFYGEVFGDDRLRKMAFVFSVLGSGMGWLVIPTGYLTSDFWVAEAFPFLSSYSNPHFTFGLSLMLILVGFQPNKSFSICSIILLAVCSLLLSLINPFGIVVVIVVMIGLLVWLVYRRLRYLEIIVKVFITGLSGLPLLLYDLWVTKSDEAFAVWNKQNLTPSPPIWDFILSFSPMLVLSLIYIIYKLKKKTKQNDLPVILLMLWSGLGIPLLYLPLNLQRRFMMGLYIPIVGLAVLGLETLARRSPSRFIILSVSNLIIALPTNIVIILAAFSGIQSHDPSIYLDRQEYAAIRWLIQNTKPDDIVLCSPDMGLFIPAYTGRRVIYGHPFETINAKEEKDTVLDFYSGGNSLQQQDDFIKDRDIDYIMVGVRENRLGNLTISHNWDIVFRQENVVLYQVQE